MFVYVAVAILKNNIKDDFKYLFFILEGIASFPQIHKISAIKWHNG